MLIDDWVHTTEIEVNNPERVWGNEASTFTRRERLRQVTTTLAAMRRAQKFVLSPLTIETASRLGDDRAAVRRTAPYLFLPAFQTWIDLTGEQPAGGIPGARQGILLIGTGDTIVSGEALYIAYLRHAPGHEADWGGGGFLQVGARFDLANGLLMRGLYPEQTRMFRTAGGDLDRLAATVWSAIALLNTPRIAHVLDADLSRLNGARSRHGRVPILEHKLVTIAIDRGDLGNGAQLHRTDERPLHHVRAFLRLKRGKVELVRPHWRGNPRFGVIVHRYVTMMAEDEAGPWKGGPLPPPRIIRELSED